MGSMAMSEVGHDYSYKEKRNISSEKTADLVRENPGHTSAELAELAYSDTYTLARQVIAAEQERLITRGPIRQCKRTARDTITWLPQPE